MDRYLPPSFLAITIMLIGYSHTKILEYLLRTLFWENNLKNCIKVICNLPSELQMYQVTLLNKNPLFYTLSETEYY
jgi:hypothetical protein